MYLFRVFRSINLAIKKRTTGFCDNNISINTKLTIFSNYSQIISFRGIFQQKTKVGRGYVSSIGKREGARGKLLEFKVRQLQRNLFCFALHNVLPQ